MLTMVRITTLDDWGNFVQPIYEVSRPLALFLVFYVALSAFGLMNVFVAVITDAVISEKGRQNLDALHGRVMEHEAVLQDIFQTCTALNHDKEIDQSAFTLFLRNFLEDPVVFLEDPEQDYYDQKAQAKAAYSPQSAGH